MNGSPRVIVVGSGPAAAMAARILVDRGVRVLMLETGEAPTAGLIVRAAGNVIVRRLPNHHLSEKGRHTSPQGRSTEWWQSLTPGGRSNHWTAAVPRFAPGDFVDGARLGPELVWPVGYDDLAAYYDAVEDLLHVTAGRDHFEQLPGGRAAYRRSLPSDWEPVAESALAGGRGLTPMPMAIGKRWMAARRGTEFSSYHSIVRPLLERSNFELRLGAHVIEVLPSDGSSKGPGVRYRSRHEHSIESVRGDAVVLGAGALATTRLLLASRSSDAPSGVGNSRGVVGRYLHDHPKSWFPFTVSKPLTLPSHMLYLLRQSYDAAAPLTGAGMTISLGRPVDRLKTYVRAKGTDLGVQVFGTQRPTSAVGVQLLDERDDNGDPKIAIDFGPVSPGHGVVERSAEHLRDVFAGAGIDADAPAGAELGPPGSSVHIGGTVRMHDDPEFGALDHRNRLHDMPDILVCDMSAFTTGPEKNPTLTAMALAARAADHLADTLDA